MASDPKLDHAREFTDIEDLTLDVWLRLENAGQDDLAAKLLDAGLMFEHYTSLLDNDPSKRSIGEIAQQAQLSFKLQDLVRQAQEALSRTTASTPAQWNAWAKNVTDTLNRLTGGFTNGSNPD